MTNDDQRNIAAHQPLNGDGMAHHVNDPAVVDESTTDETVALKGDDAAAVVSIVSAQMRRASNKSGKDGDAEVAAMVESAEFEPPDGGARAWAVMISAFLCNSILFGIINTYGSVYLTLQEQMKTAGEKDASSKAALVGSLTIGTTFLLSTVSGILTDQIGVRNTTLIGGLLAAGGMFLSALFVHNITALYLTYGVMFGLGAALAYTPSIAILGHYFKRYLGLVNGFVTAGSSLSTALLPFFLDHMIHTYSLEWTFCVLGIFTLFIIACSLIYRPLRPQQQKPVSPVASGSMSSGLNGKTATSRSATDGLRSLINTENWKRPRYVIWAVSIPVALIGYFVPYVHTPKLVRDTFLGCNENTPIMCIGAASGVGRLVCGFLADRPGINRIHLQQCSFVAIGLLTMVIPLTSSYTVLLCICTAMGLFDGCFISLLGPVAYEICGPHGATQGIGFLLGMCSIPLTIGPPIAGMLYDQTSSYTMSYVLAGIPMLIGSSMMCMMRCVEGGSAGSSSEEDGEESGEEMQTTKRNGRMDAECGNGDVQAQMPLARPAWIEDTLSSIKITCNGNGHAMGNGHHNHAHPATPAQLPPSSLPSPPPAKAANGLRRASMASTESLNDHVDRH